MPGNFRQLDAYRLAADLAYERHVSVRGWSGLERYVIGSQLLRAAYSVAANIAEGTGRWHVKDRQRLFWIARGSLNEAEHWILAAERQGLLGANTASRTDPIARTLNGLIRKEARDQ